MVELLNTRTGTAANDDPPPPEPALPPPALPAPPAPAAGPAPEEPSGTTIGAPATGAPAGGPPGPAGRGPAGGRPPGAPTAPGVPAGGIPGETGGAGEGLMPPAPGSGATDVVAGAAVFVAEGPSPPRASRPTTAATPAMASSTMPAIRMREASADPGPVISSSPRAALGEDRGHLTIR